MDSILESTTKFPRLHHTETRDFYPMELVNGSLDILSCIALSIERQAC